MFEMQKALDERIIKEKGLEGQDLLPNLILALQVELAECENEWRGFKHWSNDREPRICVIDKKGQTAKEYYKNPLLEEYVDCLHFILSIGNRIGFNNDAMIQQIIKRSKERELETNIGIGKAFSHLMSLVFGFYFSIEDEGTYVRSFERFLNLGQQLGFTPEQIEAAYMEKNAVNHQRQQEGY